MSRQTIPLKYSWKFTRADDVDSMAAAHDDTAWETVRVPHDWAIAGPFDREHDIQRIVRKQADVEVGVTEITGRTGGLPHVGVGWYRKALSIPADAAGKRVRIEIDGAMSRSQVYCKLQHRRAVPERRIPGAPEQACQAHDGDLPHCLAGRALRAGRAERRGLRP